MDLGRPTLRSWAWNVGSAVLLVGVAAGWVGYGLLKLGLDRPTQTLILLGLPALVLAVGAIRLLTLKVTATPDALIVRELLRTHKLPWAWLHFAEVRRSKGVHIDLSGTPVGTVVHNPVIHYAPILKARRTLTVTALGAWRPRVAQRRAAQINELIERYSGRRPTGT